VFNLVLDLIQTHAMTIHVSVLCQVVLCLYIIVIIGLECGKLQLECDMQISLHDISMYSYFSVSLCSMLYIVYTSVYACGLLMYRKTSDRRWVPDKCQVQDTGRGKSCLA